MTEIEKSYLAGFFDGEGNINICKGTLQVSVAQVDREIIDYIRANYEGSITKRRHSLKNPKWHDAYQWNTKTKKARRFLEDLLPYLRYKKPQALLAIEHQKQKSSVRTGFKINNKCANSRRAIGNQYGSFLAIHPVTSITAQ